jgi:hypothetical protein
VGQLQVGLVVGSKARRNIANTGTDVELNVAPHVSAEGGQNETSRSGEIEVEITRGGLTDLERKMIENFFDWLFAEVQK